MNIKQEQYHNFWYFPHVNEYDDSMWGNIHKKEIYTLTDSITDNMKNSVIPFDCVYILYKDSISSNPKTDIYKNTTKTYQFVYTYFKTVHNQNADPKVEVKRQETTVQTSLKLISDYGRDRDEYFGFDSYNPACFIAPTIQEFIDSTHNIKYEIIDSPLKNGKVLIKVNNKYLRNEDNDIEFSQDGQEISHQIFWYVWDKLFGK